ncbi:MAG: DUF4831 family protein [Bacteroidota bacterium]|nr:DUF4831 family protein [Bacteroidota bacterium]
MKMKMKSIVFVFFALAFFTSACQKGWYVTENPAPKKKEKALVYCLPKKQIHLTIALKKAHFIPGPYAEFATPYLSLQNIKYKEKYFYAISDVECHTSAIADPDRRFYIVPDKNLPALSFSQQAVLSGINLTDVDERAPTSAPAFLPEKLDNPANPDFTNIQIDKSKYEVIDTTYRIVQRDSVVKRIPVYQTKEKQKTIAQKAKDAADFIIRIRKNRFSLEAAIEEQKVSGVDIAYMIEKLEALEQSYLALFTGKLKTEMVELHYTLTPEKKQEEQGFVLDYFDKNTGKHVEQNDKADKLELLVLPLTGKNNEATDSTGEKNKKALAYCQAKPVELSLYLNDKKIFVHREAIPQMGTIRYLPSDVADQDTKIKLDPRTGEIIFIN